MKKAERKIHPHAKKSNENDSPLAIWTKQLLRATLISLAIGLVLLIGLSLAAYFYADPDALVRPLGLVAAGLTAMVGGFATVRIHGDSALICGLLIGSILTALMMLASLFCTALSSEYSVGISALLHLGFMLLSVVGAYIGLKKTQKKKKHKTR